MRAVSGKNDEGVETAFQIGNPRRATRRCGRRDVSVATDACPFFSATTPTSDPITDLDPNLVALGRVLSTLHSAFEGCGSTVVTILDRAGYPYLASVWKC